MESVKTEVLADDTSLRELKMTPESKDRNQEADLKAEEDEEKDETARQEEDALEEKHGTGRQEDEDSEGKRGTERHEEEVNEENNNDNEKLPPIKTLADLIYVCRDKGYQIYNDKPNIPEAERKRLEELKHETALREGKKHFSDDLKAFNKRKRKSSTSTHASSTKENLPILPKMNDSLPASRKTSAKSSPTGRSRATSGNSNMTNTAERPNRALDAEEWHQYRMRKKARKRREMKNAALAELLKKKQGQVEVGSVSTFNSTENGEQNSRVPNGIKEQEITRNTQVNNLNDKNSDSSRQNISTQLEKDDKQKSEINSEEEIKGHQVNENEKDIPKTHSVSKSDKSLQESQIKDDDSGIVMQTNHENETTHSNAVDATEHLMIDSKMDNESSEVETMSKGLETNDDYKNDVSPKEQHTEIDNQTNDNDGAYIAMSTENGTNEPSVNEPQTGNDTSTKTIANSNTTSNGHSDSCFTALDDSQPDHETVTNTAMDHNAPTNIKSSDNNANDSLENDATVAHSKSEDSKHDEQSSENIEQINTEKIPNDNDSNLLNSAINIPINENEPSNEHTASKNENITNEPKNDSNASNVDVMTINNPTLEKGHSDASVNETQVGNEMETNNTPSETNSVGNDQKGANDESVNNSSINTHSESNDNGQIPNSKDKSSEETMNSGTEMHHNNSTSRPETTNNDNETSSSNAINTDSESHSNGHILNTTDPLSEGTMSTETDVHQNNAATNSESRNNENETTTSNTSNKNQNVADDLIIDPKTSDVVIRNHENMDESDMPINESHEVNNGDTNDTDDRSTSHQVNSNEKNKNITTDDTRSRSRNDVLSPSSMRQTPSENKDNDIKTDEQITDNNNLYQIYENQNFSSKPSSANDNVINDSPKTDSKFALGLTGDAIKIPDANCDQSLSESNIDHQEPHTGDNKSTSTPNEAYNNEKVDNSLDNLGNDHSTSDNPSKSPEQSPGEGKTEEVTPEMRIQDGNATLILYKVRENTFLSRSNTTGDMKKTETTSKSDDSIDSENLKHVTKQSNASRGNSVSGDESISKVNTGSLTNMTPVRQVNNSQPSLNKFNERSRDGHESSVASTARSNEGDVPNNTEGQSQSKDIEKGRQGSENQTPVSDDKDNKNTNNIQSEDGAQKLNSNSNDRDTQSTNSNSDRKQSKSSEPDNQPTTSGTAKLKENDSDNRDSHGITTKPDRKENHVKVEEIDTRPIDERILIRRALEKRDLDNNKEQTDENIDRDSKMRSNKPPKRSIGNGFLVSSNDDDNIVQLADVVGSRTKGSRQGASSSSSRETQQREIEYKYALLSGSLSSTSSSLAGLPPEARMMLLLQKARQSNHQYGEEHTKTIDLIKEARVCLRQDYRKFRNGEDIVEEVRQRERVVEETPRQTREPVYEVEEEEEEDVNHEADDDQDYTTEDESEEEDYEVKVDVNVDIVKNIKRNAAKRIDSRWNPNDLVIKRKLAKDRKMKEKEIEKQLEKEKQMVKQQNKKGQKQKKPTKNGTYYASQHLPDENEYIREAKRIYPKGFVKRELDRKQSEKRMAVSDSEKENNYLEENRQRPRKSKKTSNVPNGRYDIDYDTPRPMEAHRNDNKKKTFHVQNNIVNGETKTDTVQKLPYLKAGGKGGNPVPAKQRRKKDNDEFGQRSPHIDKAFAHEYDMYLQSKPRVRPTINSNKNKMTSPARYSTDKLPNFDNGVKHRKETHNRYGGPHSERNGYDNRHGYSDQDSPVRVQQRYGNESSSGSDKSGEEVTINEAIDIVKTRNRYYQEVKADSAKSGRARDSRVLKLFKEIQYIRKMTGSYNDNLNKIDDTTPSTFRDPQTGFLLMNYNTQTGETHVGTRASNQALDRFLHEKLDYEVCSKMKVTNVSLRKRERALEELKQKLFVRT